METCDILLENGLIFDGSGAAARKGGVALRSGRIVAVGDLAGFQADERIDLMGQAIAPGFIDVHTHDDVEVLQHPEMTCKITQGVTTVIVGNCGISAAPFRHQEGLPPPFTMNLMDAGNSFPNVEAYRNAITARRPSVNVAILAGHSSLRANVMGTDLFRGASEAEISAMAESLDQAIRQGAIGLSSGLDYPPAGHAPTQEVIALARVLGAHRFAIYTSHIRDEGDEVIAAVEEAIRIGREAETRAVISHHKCSGVANFGKSHKTLALIEAAQKDQPLGLDVYPYTASSTALMKEFLGSADEVLVMWSQTRPEVGGRRLNDIAAEMDLSREEAVDALSPAGAIYFDMDEDDLQRIMKFPTSMIGSDGIPGSAKPHPRLWGTFPRVLGHYARDLALFPLETAVHKMTGLPAKTFGFQDRGWIDVGMVADLVVFDPASIRDTATFDDPEVAAEGVTHVVVGGDFALRDGAMTGSRNGAFVTHG